ENARRRRVLSTAAIGFLLLARRCRLNQRQVVFAPCGAPLLHLGGDRRKPPIRRIYDQRGPSTRVLPQMVDSVVCTSDVVFRTALGAVIVIEPLRALYIQRRNLSIREGLAVADPGWPLQRRRELIGPDALQVGFAPGCTDVRGLGF